LANLSSYYFSSQKRKYPRDLVPNRYREQRVAVVSSNGVQEVVASQKDQVVGGSSGVVEAAG
jgi:hypothetical protein